jgi:hypothetical protein
MAETSRPSGTLTFLFTDLEGVGAEYSAVDVDQGFRDAAVYFIR